MAHDDDDDDVGLYAYYNNAAAPVKVCALTRCQWFAHSVN